MKKTLLVSALITIYFCLQAFAQTNTVSTSALQFINAGGTALPDGGVLIIDRVEEDPFGGALINSCLFVSNSADEAVMASIEVSVSSISGGTLQCCFPQNCLTYTRTGIYETPVGTIPANTARKNLQTEWVMPESGIEGNATARFRLKIYQADASGADPVFIGYGPAINVCFFSSSPTGISAAASAPPTNSIIGIFDLSGNRLKELKRGVNIVRYSDGTTRKVIK